MPLWIGVYNYILQFGIVCGIPVTIAAFDEEALLPLITIFSMHSLILVTLLIFVLENRSYVKTDKIIQR